MSKEKENFETAIQKLEKLIEELNQGNSDLDSTLNKFKDGVALIKNCREDLSRVENEFKKIKAELELNEDQKPKNGD